MLVGPTGDTAPAGGAGEKTHLHQIGLIDVLEGNCLLIDGSRQGLQAHRAAAVVLNDAGEHPPVDGVQPQVVHLQCRERLVCHRTGNHTPGLHLGKVPHPAQHSVGDAGRATAAAGDLHCAVRLYGNVQQAGRPGDNLRQLLRCVELQAQGHAEAVPQGCGELPCPGGSADQGEAGQIQPDGVGRGPLADDDVDGEVLHGRV